MYDRSPLGDVPIGTPCQPDHVVETVPRILGLRKRKQSRTNARPDTR